LPFAVFALLGVFAFKAGKWELRDELFSQLAPASTAIFHPGLVDSGCQVNNAVVTSCQLVTDAASDDGQAGSLSYERLASWQLALRSVTAHEPEYASSD
jgi:hypothetical protein